MYARGVIAVNTSTFIGCKTHGILGGIAATAGMITPSLIIITIIAAFIQQFAHLAVVQHAFAGIRIAVCALVLQSVWKMAKKGVVTFRPVLSCSLRSRLSPSSAYRRL